jgi:hypothetical protein
MPATTHSIAAPQASPSSDELREHILAWLEANGIDYRDIPAEPQMSLTDGTLTTLVRQRGSGGQLLIVGDYIENTTATFPITVEPPADVAAWLMPRCPTCGR